MFRRRREESLNHEIQDYLDRQTSQNIEAGMSPEEARLAARRKLGPAARVMEETREASAGGMWTWLGLLWQDLRHGIRMFVKNPGFTLTAVLSLAFGTGANVAMFSAADALLLRPLPVPRAREIVTVGTEYNTGDFGHVRTSYLNYLDIRDQSRSFEGLAAYATSTAGLAANSGAVAEVKPGMVVTGNFFELLGVAPELGRGFRPEEDQVRGRDAVVVLSHSLWESMGADPKILGRTVQISGIEFTVIGVVPEAFTGPERDVLPAFYIPAAMWPRTSGDPNTLDARDSWRMVVKGRLKAGVTAAQAQAELDAIAKNLERMYPDTNRNQRLTLRTELQMNILRNRVYTAFAAIVTVLALAVLIVACANVAGLLTSRAPLRAREIALRLAVGAGRGRLIRQLLTESSLIAVAGGLLGLPLAYIGIQLMRQIQFPTDLIAVPRIELDLRALLFSLLVAMGSVILFGLIPAIQTTRANLTTAFKGTDVEIGRRRLWGRNLLVAAQVAASMLVLTVGVFVYRAFAAELTQGMGFRTNHLLMMSIHPGLVRYNDAQAKQFFETLTRRAETLPGVQSAALSSAVPVGLVEGSAIEPEGFRLPAGQNYAVVYSSRVDQHYFDTLRIPIMRGRGFAETDTSDSPLAAVVNETLAAHYWPNEDPLGKRFRMLGAGWVQVVGIARNSRYVFISEPPTDFLYLAYRQLPQGELTLFAASTGESASLIAPLRNLVKDLDPNMPIYDVQTMEHYYNAMAIRIAEVLTEIIGSMGLMGLMLAMIGLYALMSYSVSRRTREIGVRIAVGADGSSVMGMVVRQGMTPVIIGIAVGLVLSAGAGRLLHASFPLGYNIGPGIYGMIAPALLIVAMAAALVPARRASLVDPMTALREE